MSKAAPAVDVVPGIATPSSAASAKPGTPPLVGGEQAEGPTGMMRRLVLARRIIPFTLVHLAVFSIFFVRFTWWALLATLLVYLFLQVGSAGWLHRYFSHRCFKTSRWFQAVLAFWGGCCAQRGALWWAAHHRRHHAYSDKEHDPHSPHVDSFWHAHVAWIWEDEFQGTDHRWVKDLARYPELVFLDRLYWVPVLAFWTFITAVGAGFGAVSESFTVTEGALSFFAWGAILGTVLAWHATFAINSITHLYGWKRYATDDESRNSMLIAVLNLGEGWHNNHHYYPYAGHSGSYWWEIDPPFYLMLLFERLGLIHDLKRVPKKAVEGQKYRIEKD